MRANSRAVSSVMEDGVPVVADVAVVDVVGSATVGPSEVIWLGHI